MRDLSSSPAPLQPRRKLIVVVAILSVLSSLLVPSLKTMFSKGGMLGVPKSKGVFASHGDVYLDDPHLFSRSWNPLGQ